MGISQTHPHRHNHSKLEQKSPIRAVISIEEEEEED
jgi:hypothetical protein